MNQDFLYDIGNLTGRALDAPNAIARNLLAGNDPTQGVLSGDSATGFDIEDKLGTDQGGGLGEIGGMLLGALLMGGAGLGTAFMRGWNRPSSTMPKWYSRLDKAAEGLPEGQMSYSRMLNLLAKAKEGHSPEEIKWRELDSLAGDPYVTRDSVLAHLKEHPMVVDHETVTSGSPYKRYSLAGPEAFEPSKSGRFTPEPAKPENLEKFSELTASEIPYTEHILGFRTGDEPSYIPEYARIGEMPHSPLDDSAPDMSIIAHLRTTAHNHPEFGKVLFGNEGQSNLHQTAQSGMHGSLPTGYMTEELRNAYKDSMEEASRRASGHWQTSDRLYADVLSHYGGDEHLAGSALYEGEVLAKKFSRFYRSVYNDVVDSGDPNSIHIFYDNGRVYAQAGKGTFDIGAQPAGIPERVLENGVRADVAKSIAIKEEGASIPADMSYASKVYPKRRARLVDDAHKEFMAKTGVDPTGLIDASEDTIDSRRLADAVLSKYGKQAEDMFYEGVASGSHKNIEENYKGYLDSREAIQNLVDAYGKVLDMDSEYKSLRSAPDMPYKNSWEGLLIRKLIHEAVSGGHSAVGIADPKIMTSSMHTKLENSNLPALLKGLLSYMRTKDPDIVSHPTELGHVVPMTQKFIDNIRKNGQYLMGALPLAGLLANNGEE